MDFYALRLVFRHHSSYLPTQTIVSTGSTLSSSRKEPQTVAMGAPSNGSKTSQSKVANGNNAGTSSNTNQINSKRSSSGADGDYQLVQHEVLYSQSSQYEVSFGVSWLKINLCKSTKKMKKNPEI